MGSISRAPLENSLYTSAACQVWFRNKGPLHITRGALNRCPKLVARLQKAPFKESFDWANIKETSIEVGHVVIHFLVTNRYERLEPHGATGEERNRHELSTAFHVYAAATQSTFDLPNLQELAEAEIKRLGCQMNIVSVARTLENSFVNLEPYPGLEKHLMDELVIVLTTSTKAEIDSMISHLGAPRKVSMVFLEYLFEAQKQLLDAEEFKQKNVATPRPWDEFELELEDLVRRFSGQFSMPKELGYQRVLRAVSDSFDTSALKAQREIEGELCATDQGRLERMENGSVLLSKGLSECQSEIEASRERLRELKISARSIVERIIAEQQIELLLKCQKEQGGLSSTAQQQHLSALRKQAGQTQFWSSESVSSEVSDDSTGEYLRKVPVQTPELFYGNTKHGLDDGIMTPMTESSEDERGDLVLSKRSTPTKPRVMASLIDRISSEEPPLGDNSSAAIPSNKSITKPSSQIVEDNILQPRKETRERVAMLRLDMDKKRMATRQQQQDQPDIPSILLELAFMAMLLFVSLFVLLKFPYLHYRLYTVY
ncbi:hypothetical protein FHETE_2449 [Fusarium heterosporum]|uniref:Uncharacterized protein n=1 Tax=Fusarium heterosporum TaxID=42747 RepID=A0A8H5TTI9_FUSHE|nr:hypothetical protein FHETE_2449 [Fusarium heterosporum]